MVICVPTVRFDCSSWSPTVSNHQKNLEFDLARWLSGHRMAHPCPDRWTVLVVCSFSEHYPLWWGYLCVSRELLDSKIVQTSNDWLAIAKYMSWVCRWFMSNGLQSIWFFVPWGQPGSGDGQVIFVSGGLFLSDAADAAGVLGCLLPGVQDSNMS